MDRFSSLDDVLRRIWTQIEEAADNPGHSLRALTFGTMQETAPHLRTVILREANAETRQLSFHTDRRSQKVEDLRGQSRVAWLGWDPETREQVRLHGTATVHTEDDVADRLWRAEDPGSLTVYVRSQAPGTPLEEPDDGLSEAVHTKSVTRADVEPGRKYFSVIRTVVDEMTWLHLHPEGHYRARFRFDPDAGAFEGRWIVP